MAGMCMLDESILKYIYIIYFAVKLLEFKKKAKKKQGQYGHFAAC
jgi:hypothetical protein